MRSADVKNFLGIVNNFTLKAKCRLFIRFFVKHVIIMIIKLVVPLAEKFVG